MADHFAVRTTRRASRATSKRIAVSEDGQTVVAFAGYLYTEDDTARRARRPLPCALYWKHGLQFPVNSTARLR